ncbi:MAG: hypothetical protein QOH04_1898, partial [Sphingomonadales bacterium]|nr:hypothetical protein [Sphingomonadales bacterium]
MILAPDGHVTDAALNVTEKSGRLAAEAT